MFLLVVPLLAFASCEKNPDMDKLDSHTIEYLEGHVKRLSKVMSTYPNLVDSYVYLLSTFENTHLCHVANRCTSQ